MQNSPSYTPVDSNERRGEGPGLSMTLTMAEYLFVSCRTSESD